MMTIAKIGRWGASLAVKIPLDVVDATGVDSGEDVEVEVQNGNILIRRSAALGRARADALAAMEEILAEREKHSLGELTVRMLIDEGRM